MSNTPAVIITASVDDNRAFTLLEVMVAVAIIAIAFTTLLGSQARSLSYGTECYFNTMAPLLASQKMAELKSGKIGMESSDGDFGDDFPGFRWTIEVEDAAFADYEPLADMKEPLQKVDLTVEWNEAGFRYAITYYALPPQQ